jgi:hypothetical protein
MPAKIDPDVEVPVAPFLDENRPGMPRHSTVLDSERKQSGDLPIQPVDNPVIDDKPFKNLR